MADQSNSLRERRYASNNGPDKWELLTSVGTEGQVTTFRVIDYDAPEADWEIWGVELTGLDAISLAEQRWVIRGNILWTRPGCGGEKQAAVKGSHFEGSWCSGQPLMRGEFTATVAFD